MSDERDYPLAREFFGFSASEVVRGLPDDCSAAKIAEVAMVACWRECMTVRPVLEDVASENVLHIRKVRP